MALDVFDIETELLTSTPFEAKEGHWDGSKLKVAASKCNLSDNAAMDLILKKKVFTVKGWSHAVDTPTTGGIPRPKTQMKQDFVQKLKMSKYKRNGACEFVK